MAKDMRIIPLGLLVFSVMSGNVYADSKADLFAKYIAGIPHLSVNNETSADGDVIAPANSTGYTGTYGNRMATSEERRRLTRNLEKIVAFDPNAGVLYPGSLIQGRSLPDGVLYPISTERRPQTCTVSGIVGSGDSNYSATFVPSAASAAAAISKILSQRLAADQPARMTYTMTTYNSLEEGLLKLGASYSWLSGKIEGSFSTTDSHSLTRLLVRFVQTYYTVSCDAPVSSVAVFDSKADFEALKVYMGPGNPPALINSVTYGRELWMLIESSHAESEIKSALDAALNFGVSSGKVDFNDGQKKTISESSVQVLVLGGSGKAAVNVVTGDASKIAAFINAGADYSGNAPGLPISYTAMYLNDNSIARISSTSDYVIKTSVASPVPAPVIAVRAIWQTNGDGKDFNTQPIVDVTDKSGRTVAHVDCCSADRNGDKWVSGQTTSAPMRVVVPFTTNDVEHGSIAAKRIAKGKDDWDYSLNVEFTFADGTQTRKSCSGRNSCGVVW
jgi:thiol-activated cytolysin